MVAILDVCVKMMFKHQNDVIVINLVIDLSKKGSSHMTNVFCFKSYLLSYFLSWYWRPSWIWPSGEKYRDFWEAPVTYF